VSSYLGDLRGALAEEGFNRSAAHHPVERLA